MDFLLNIEQVGNISIITMNNEYIRFVDPGHSWLRVPLNELVIRGVISDISEYSPMYNGFAYLEEDCDMGRFFKSLVKDVDVIKITDRYVDNFDEYLSQTRRRTNQIVVEQTL